VEKSAAFELILRLRQSGVLADDESAEFEELRGGVASDIWLVTSGTKRFVVKRALAKLRVAADWQVPISRNACEVAWLKAAAAVMPEAVPDVLAHDPEAGFFVMTYFEPARHPVWKQELRESRAKPEFATQVGASVASIHAATLNANPADFNSNDVFRSIRLEPYLEATARKHPDIKPQLDQLVATTLLNHRALVHGDISPKNILCGPKGPIFLDAECAWFGDPAFDIAFCLNHLLLKCLWTPHALQSFVACFDALAAAYLGGVTWEDAAAIERRIAALLPALLLARIDGKSPVEYVTDEAVKQKVRDTARPLIKRPPKKLQDISNTWANLMRV
jgi:fructosamine-3-kinase